ncbi:type VI secretion system protein TssA [Sphingomonas endolithica]|uniref:type VI secretion system protein TssA n=1 Tax=Sphingomonas endolithica TaxID=2972485 RepID=UPI0021B01B13|nr:type VI secretion system protein TssA [Sphingomonas sp. ZFBP2030]
MSTALGVLLAPVSDDAPAGPDLSYDAERQAIEQAFETQGYSSELDENVDWRETLRLIEAQSARTKDVWLAVYMARAGTRIGSLETVETGCALLAGLFEQYWDSVHPTLEEYGLQGRKGACESLTRIAEFLRPLQQTMLIEHPRLGSYSGDDFARFARDGESAEGFGMFRAAMADTSLETLQAIVSRLEAIDDALRRADAVVSVHAAATGDLGTNFAPTLEAIAAIRRAILPYMGASVSPEADSDVADVSESDDAGSNSARAPGRIDSREDVMRALDAIGDYYQRREPSSPIPIALRRIRGWISMDFMAILKDIAPSSVSDVGAVLVARVDDSGYSDM